MPLYVTVHTGHEYLDNIGHEFQSNVWCIISLHEHSLVVTIIKIFLNEFALTRIIESSRINQKVVWSRSGVFLSLLCIVFIQ